MLEYPCWLYHLENPEGVIVKDEEEKEALGPGWVDHPGKCGQFEETLPAPDVEEPVKRRRGRPRKHPLPDKDQTPF
jgi:hypothetical protein